MDFRSDNVAIAAAEILEAIQDTNRATAAPYGADAQTSAMNERFRELFECPVNVLPVSTGIAANALSLSVCAPPFGLIYCHASAHILHRESGATEFFTGGAKVVPVPGSSFKIDPVAFGSMVEADFNGLTSKAPPSALSLTQSTDGGTLYQLDEIRALCAIAKRYGMKVHLDGARFANAVCALACSPADITWRAGVDIMSFGATKNGAMSTDAIVVFDEALVKELKIRARRAGQNASKMRFASAQLERYVRGGLWLKLAAQANSAAARVSELLSRLPQVEITAPVEANEVFLRLPERAIDLMEQRGVRFYRRGAGNIRLVCRFDIEPAEIEGLHRVVREAVSAS